jgi:hypothetical protein
VISPPLFLSLWIIFSMLFCLRGVHSCGRICQYAWRGRSLVSQLCSPVGISRRESSGSLLEISSPSLLACAVPARVPAFVHRKRCAGRLCGSMFQSNTRIVAISYSNAKNVVLFGTSPNHRDFLSRPLSFFVDDHSGKILDVVEVGESSLGWRRRWRCVDVECNDLGVEGVA